MKAVPGASSENVEKCATNFAVDPIEVPVKDALDVDQIFDSISYLKGSSVIRMLATHLGQETFLKGVSNYLKDHSYGNATTNDLWSALSEVSGQDINALMESVSIFRCLKLLDRLSLRFCS